MICIMWVITTRLGIINANVIGRDAPGGGFCGILRGLGYFSGQGAVHNSLLEFDRSRETDGAKRSKPDLQVPFESGPGFCLFMSPDLKGVERRLSEELAMPQKPGTISPLRSVH